MRNAAQESDMELINVSIESDDGGAGCRSLFFLGKKKPLLKRLV